MVKVLIPKSIIFFSLFLIFGCNQYMDETTVLGKVWSDRYGNTYTFKNNGIQFKAFKIDHEWDLTYNYFFDKNTLILNCSEDELDTIHLKINDFSEQHITFDKPIDYCDAIVNLDQQEDEFELFNGIDLRDTSEYLLSLSFDAGPVHAGGILYFKWNLDSKLIIKTELKDSLIQTILDDLTFSEIQELIQTLPLEEYENEYDFAVIDAPNYNIYIETNKIKKEINCFGGLPQGLDNLIGFINYRLYYSKKEK